MNIVDRILVLIMLICLEDSLRADGVIGKTDPESLAISLFYLVVSVFYGWAWTKISENRQNIKEVIIE